jgi:hypothetical protein
MLQSAILPHHEDFKGQNHSALATIGQATLTIYPRNVLLTPTIRLALLLVQGHTLHHVGFRGGISMGAFGGYTRWAVVFLIIFVLFFLLVPGYYGGGGGSCAGGGYGY